jgi:hypothetical protein
MIKLGSKDLLLVRVGIEIELTHIDLHARSQLFMAMSFSWSGFALMLFVGVLSLPSDVTHFYDWHL